MATNDIRFTSTRIPTMIMVALAKRSIQAPGKIGRHRAQWLLDLYRSSTALPAERALGRKALQACADAVGRSAITLANGRLIGDRVYTKASTARLARWARDIGTDV